MIRKLLLAAALSLISSAAFATCGAIPLPVLDATGTSRNISSATAADGNCKTYVDADTGSQMHQDMTAALPVQGSGTTGGQAHALINCDKHMFAHITTATDTLAVQGVASQTIYICRWRSRAAGVATWFLENTASVNANCSSTLTQIIGLATEAINTGEATGSPFWDGLKNTSGNGLCINSTGTGGLDLDIWYAQF